MQVKTRLQAADCHPKANQLSVTTAILRSDGLSGLWRGTSPAAARAALLTASQCVTYDVVKQTIRSCTGADDTFAVQFATGAQNFTPPSLPGTVLHHVELPQLSSVVKLGVGKHADALNADALNARCTRRRHHRCCDNDSNCPSGCPQDPHVCGWLRRRCGGSK
jgi:hypothetical protein